MANGSRAETHGTGGHCDWDGGEEGEVVSWVDAVPQRR